MQNVETWQHVFKLDPAKTISEADLEAICLSGTDAIMIGGTDGITLEAVMELFYRVRKYQVHCALEISRKDSVMPGFDSYFVPFVLNTTKKKWLGAIQHEAVKEYGMFIPWHEMFAEGYCILNKRSKVFTYTDCVIPTREDVIAYAQMVEHLFRFPIFYLEYSGTYGDVSLVEEVSSQLQRTQLFYGGGIRTVAQAREMASFADTLVVGNVIYEDIEAAIGTVRAVKEVNGRKM